MKASINAEKVFDKLCKKQNKTTKTQQNATEAQNVAARGLVATNVTFLM